MTKNRFLLAGVAAIFGILAWLSVTVGGQFTITLTVPLTIEEVPRGLAIATAVPRTVQLRYRGDGWRLILLQFGALTEIRMPYSLLRRTGSSRGPDSASVPNAVTVAGLRLMTQSEIAELAPSRAGVTLIGISPDSTVVAIDRYEERRVAVYPDILPSFREGYGQVGPITVVPESVLVGGAARVIRTISSWRTERMTFADLRAPLETDVPVRASDEIPLSFSTPTVHLSLNVQPFAEKLLGGIPVEAIAIPPSREIIFIPPRVDLVARGGIKQLAGLSPADVRVRVPYEALLNDTTGTVDPVVTGPAGIQFVSRKPERLQYVIRKRL
jgi:hypothetical protein